MDLMKLLPPNYEFNITMNQLQNILSTRVGNLENAMSETIDECFIDTSTKLLSRYEKMYGIVVDISKGNEIRQSKIKAKMSGTGTCTKNMLLNSIEAFPGGTAEIIEDNANYKFTIKFSDYYRIPDAASITEIYAITDELKPAHLGYDHTFTYNWWGIDDTGVWNDGGTWDDLRNYTEV